MKGSGKTGLITGANSGLGLATAKQFVKLSMNIVLLCRNRAKGEQVINQILRDTPKAPLELMICDLASIESVRGLWVC
jgi:NAD(P)-dependent dehydrogenase (short-subunit alcohol dehydrogenase family)